jgi:uncharacterized protein (DUF1919 family)
LIADDKSDNSVLYGHKSIPKGRIMAAVDILTNHTFNKKEPKNNNNQRNINWNDNGTALTISTQSSFNQEALKKTSRYCCGKKGHYTQINVLRRINAPRMNGH